MSLCCSFQIPLLWFDWGWLSVVSMERWVMSKSCLQPTTWESVQYSHPKSVISFILTHLSSQISTFKMLRVANNKIVWIIVCWILALSASLSLSPTALLAAFPILKEGGRRWRWLISMVPPLTAFPPTFLGCGTGTVRGHSYLFRGM